MVSFYIRDKSCKSTSVCCAINLPGQKRIYYTALNIKVSPQNWAGGRMITGQGRVSNGQVQDKLTALKTKIEIFCTEYHSAYYTYPSKFVLFEYLNSNKELKDYLPKIEKVKLVDFIESIINRRSMGKELIKGKKFAASTITHYRSTLKAINDFEAHKHKKFFYVEEFESKNMVEEFEIFLTTELNMMINTIANKMKTLKSFLQIAWSDGIIKSNPFKTHGIQIYTEETDAIVFSKDEMIELEELDLSDNPYHESIRDQYLIYLWSGIRKSDLGNLLAVVNPNANSFTFTSEKTGLICTIPAFDTLKRVAIKYDYKFPKPVTDQKVLYEIKKICKKLTTMNNNVERTYIKGGIRIRVIKKKYELVVIHTARRTLATQLVEHGLPFEQVMKITGHKKLATLQKYIKSESNLKQMLEIGNKIRKS